MDIKKIKTNIEAVRELADNLNTVEVAELINIDEFCRLLDEAIAELSKPPVIQPVVTKDGYCHNECPCCKQFNVIPSFYFCGNGLAIKEITNDTMTPGDYCRKYGRVEE